MALVAVGISGCGGGGETTEVAETRTEVTETHPAPPELLVSLDSLEGPQNIGLLMADQRGYFEDVGLDVSVANPLEQNRPVSYVAKGTDDFALAQQPQVAIAKEKGMPIVAVGSVIPHPTDAMIWLKRSKIDGIADLKGKTIAVPGIPYQERMLWNLLAEAGLSRGDVQVESVAYEVVSKLLDGSADAIFGVSWNLEGAELESLGLEPVITRVKDLGAPDYEQLVVIAPTEMVADNPEVVRDFMSAMARGTEAAVGHPEAAVKAIVKAPGPDLAQTRKAMEAQVRATLPLLSTSGYMDPDRAEGLVEWMDEEGLIESRPPASSLFTNDFH